MQLLDLSVTSEESPEAKPYRIELATRSGHREVTIDLKRYSVKTCKRARRMLSRLDMLSNRTRVNRTITCTVDRRCVLDDTQIYTKIEAIVQKCTKPRPIHATAERVKRQVSGNKGYRQRPTRVSLSR